MSPRHGRRARTALAIAVLIANGAAPAEAAPQLYELSGIGFLAMNKDPADPNASFAGDAGNNTYTGVMYEVYGPFV